MKSAGTLKYCFFLFSLLPIFFSCNIINPAEPTPTYIHIDSFSVRKNGLIPTVTTSSQISAIWVYYNNNPIGEFDLPATFPVITDGTGNGTLEIYPGIVINGLYDHMDIYPFYVPDTSFSFAPQPGKILTYEPKTEYFNSVKINWSDNFAQGAPTGFNLYDGNIFMTIDTSREDVFEGNGCGKIYMNNPGVDSSEDSTVAFPIRSGDGYIEINYKSDVPFYVGLRTNLSSYVSSSPNYLAGFYPSATWQKAYVSISQFTFQYTGTSYNLFVKTSLPPGQATGTLLLDNIQIVTF